MTKQNVIRLKRLMRTLCLFYRNSVRDLRSFISFLWPFVYVPLTRTLPSLVNPRVWDFHKMYIFWKGQRGSRHDISSTPSASTSTTPFAPKNFWNFIQPGMDRTSAETNDHEFPTPAEKQGQRCVLLHFPLVDLHDWSKNEIGTFQSTLVYLQPFQLHIFVSAKCAFLKSPCLTCILLQVVLE